MKKDLELEQEANYFAMCLLMPEKLLRQEVDKLNIDLCSDDALNKLCKLFQVPKNAMVIRLSQLGVFKKDLL